jgi:hypothetical protein
VTGCSAVYDAVTSPGTRPARQLAPSGRLLRDLIVDPYRTSVFRIVRGWDWALRRIVRAAYAPEPVHIDRAELERWRRPLHVDGTEARSRAWSATASRA